MMDLLQKFLREVDHSVVGNRIYLADNVVMPKKLFFWLENPKSPARIYFGCFGGCGYGSLQVQEVQELGDYVQLKIIPCYCHPYSYRLYIKFLH